MATVRYTHSFDGLYRFVLIIGNFFALGLLAVTLDALPDQLTEWMPEWLEIIAGIAAFIGLMAFTPVVLSKTILPWWLPTWLYVRVTLGVPITSSEANRISFLFDGSLNGTWYPLNGVRSMEKEFRREALFRFVNHLCHTNSWRVIFPEFDEDKAQQRQRRSNEQTQRPSSPPPPSVDKSRADALHVLGLNEQDATPEAIKKAYRRKISQFHPDRFADDKPEVRRYAEDMAKKLNLAYEYLAA